MATIPYSEIQYVGSGDFQSPVLVPYAPLQSAVWRKGDILTLSTTGTITLPAPTGALATAAGPLASAITFGSSASTGAPGGTYYVIVTYTATSQESMVSAEYPVNVLPGFLPTVNVSATGAPAGATNFAAYMSFGIPGYEALQQASKTTTALGSTFTAAFPLTNSTGISRAATNIASNIVGMALQDSNEVFFSGAGGSINVGNQSLLGATNSLPPLTPLEVPLGYVVKLNGGVLLEVNLRQTVYWSPTLAGSTVGLYLDPTTGFWAADPSQSNKVATIIQPADGVPSIQGTTGDFGKRVVISFLSTVTV